MVTNNLVMDKYMEEIKKDFWKTAFGFNKSQSIGQRIKEFCVTAVVIAVALIFVVSFLQGLFADNYSWDEYCEENPSSCE